MPGAKLVQEVAVGDLFGRGCRAEPSAYVKEGGKRDEIHCRKDPTVSLLAVHFKRTKRM